MKRKKILLLCLCFAFATVSVNAEDGGQEPSLDNLKHFYDFEMGDLWDQIVDADGELYGDAQIDNGMLDLIDGGSAVLPAGEIGINEYEEIAIEAWAINYQGINGGDSNMMWAFGNCTEDALAEEHEGHGQRYFIFSPRRWGGEIAARLVPSDNPWGDYGEGGPAMGAEENVGDSVMRHYVVTYDTDHVMSIYVDGELYQTEDEEGNIQVARDTLNAEWRLDSLGTDYAFIGKALFGADPSWRGAVDLFAIWDAALSAEEVEWLYDQGSKRELPAEDPNTTDDIGRHVASIDLYTASNRLYVRDYNDANNLSVTVYSIKGSVVYQTNSLSNGEYLGLNPGIYVVKAEAADNTTVQKIVIN